MSEMSERNSVLVAYGLYLVGVMTGGLTTLIGTVLAHIRLKEARGTLYESHYRNLILIFWVWLTVMVVAGSVVLAGMAVELLGLVLVARSHITPGPERN